MEPPVNLAMHLAQVDGHSVLAAEVAEVHPSHRPCFYRNQGMYRGSYIRTGDGERVMTEYEVYLALASRQQPADDRTPVGEAGVEDLDPQMVESLLGRVRTRRPGLATEYSSRDDILKMLNVMSPDGQHPTVAGLLALGRFPQRFFPNAAITVVAYSGNEPDPVTRLELDVKCEGALIKMLDTAVNVLQRVSKRRVQVTGITHQDIPEYPPLALREVLANALIHRDYGRYAIGSQVQVRLYSDRIEVQNPGGLYGSVSVDQLGEPGLEVTRNAALANLAEDMGLMENRGTGIRVIMGEMRRSLLPPPDWYDGISYFRVTLHNSTVMDEGTLTWLARVAPANLTDRQRYTLACLLHQGRLEEHGYRRINMTDATTARRELQALMRVGLINSVDSRRGKVYELKSELSAKTVSAAEDPPLSDWEAGLLSLLRKSAQPLSTRELGVLTNRNRQSVLRALKRLLNRGLVLPTSAAVRDRRQKYRAKPII